MARQYPARCLGSMKVSDIEPGAVSVVMVDASALKAALGARRGWSVKAVVTDALLALAESEKIGRRLTRKKKGK